MPIVSTRVAANTSTGNQDITISGIGTPKMVMIVATTAVADATAIDGSSFSLGMYDGSRQFASGMASEHAQSSSDSIAFMPTSAIVRIIATDLTTDGEAQPVAFITDGVRINWTDAPSTAVLLTVTFWYGDDIANAYVGSGVTSGTLNGTGTFTPGFPLANGIFGCGNVQGHSTGFVDYNGSTIVQRSVLHADRDNQPTTYIFHRVSTAYAVMKPGPAATAWGGELSNITATQFDIVSRIGGNTGVIGFGVWNYANGISHKVYTYNTPTGTSNQTDSNPNFEPDVVFYVGSLVESVDADDTSSLAGSYGVSVITSTEQYTNTISQEDNAADSNTQSLVDDQAVNLPLHNGSTGTMATFVSMQSTGPQLNWSVVFANQKKWIGLAIGAAAAGNTYTGTFSMAKTLSFTDSSILTAVGNMGLGELLGLGDTGQLSGTNQLDITKYLGLQTASQYIGTVSLELGKLLNLANSGLLTIPTSVSLGQNLGLTDLSQLTGVGSVGLTNILDWEDATQLSGTSQLSMTKYLGASEATQLAGVNSLTLGTSLGLTMSLGALVLGSISLDEGLTFSANSQLDAVGSIGLGELLDLGNSGLLSGTTNLSLGKALGLSASSSAIFVGTVGFGLDLDFNLFLGNIVLANMSLGKELAMTSSSQLDAVGTITLTRVITLADGSTQVANVTADLGKVLAVTLNANGTYSVTFGLSHTLLLALTSLVTPLVPVTVGEGSLDISDVLYYTLTIWDEATPDDY